MRPPQTHGVAISGARSGLSAVGLSRILPDAVKFHDVRLRKTDGRIAIRRASAIDRATREAAEAEARQAEVDAERARRAVTAERVAEPSGGGGAALVGLFALALASATRETASRTNPVAVTD